MAGNSSVTSDADNEQKYQKAERLKKAVNCLVQNKEKAKLCGDLANMYKSLEDYKDSKDLYNQYIELKKGYDEKAAEDEKVDKENKEKTLSAVNPTKARNNIITRIVIGIILLALIGGGIFLTTKPGKYVRASFCESINSNEKASKMFGKLKGYRDSEIRFKENLYRYAKKCAKDKKEDSAISYFRKIIDYKDSGDLLADVEINKLKKSKTGDDVIYGECHWLVLEKKNKEVFLVKYKPFQEENVAYNNLSKAVTWEDSSLREYLNSRFLKEFLTEAMIDKIKLTNVTVPDNKKYATKGGNSTKDKVFLLNADEAKKYREILDIYDRNWWLINPGNEQSTAQFVSNGEIMDYGYDVSSANINIRPAIIVSLEQ